MKFIIIGKFFVFAFLAIFVIDLLSYAGQSNPAISSGSFVILLIIVFGLAMWRIEYGLYFILAELFVGGLGYLLEFHGIPVRMGLFGIVILAWIIDRIKNQELRIKNIRPTILSLYNRLDSIFLILYSCLILVIIFGIVNGLLANKAVNVYKDSNAWIFFLLLPVFILVVNKPGVIEKIIQLLMAASSYLAVKTIIVLILFSRGIAVLHDPFYNWLRDTGVGEITPMGDNIFRVFFQSHFYCLIGLLLIVAAILFKADFGKKINIYLACGYVYLMGFALVISQSRSIWIGALISVLFLLVISFFYKVNIWRISLIAVILAAMVASQFSLLQFAAGGPLGNRFSEMTDEAAGASRLNQLQPLAEGIYLSPFFGHGFGKTLTYISKDPRVLLHSGTGEFTTYAFEWGYLDIALKVGLIGSGVYLALIILVMIVLAKSAKCQAQNNSEKFKAANFGFLAGLVALSLINIFTPYLNHPLGIGYILLCLAFIMRQEKQLAENNIYGKQ